MAHNVHDHQPFRQVLDREQFGSLFQSQDQCLHLILQADHHLGGSFVSFDVTHAEYDFSVLSDFCVPGRWELWENWLSNWLVESCTVSPLTSIIPRERLFTLFLWLRLHLSNQISDTLAFSPLSMRQSFLCSLVLKVRCSDFGAGKYYKHVLYLGNISLFKDKMKTQCL